MKLFFWYIYYPILKFLSFFVFWIPEFQERKKFELKNIDDELSQSFSRINVIADLCFEFSSEGEFQQVASLVEDALKEEKKIELVFFSPSVEKAILKLAQSYPNQIRYLRFPLLTLSPLGQNRSFLKWVTSRKLIMVRYDLFLDFLTWKTKRDRKLIFLSATFKKERLRSKKISWLKMNFLKLSDLIFFASPTDLKFGESMSLKGQSFDFRVEQIHRRLVMREKKFQENFPEYFQLKKIWDSYPYQKRLIIGNAWPSDLFLFTDIPSDVFVLVVPHKIDDEFVDKFQTFFTETKRDTCLISDLSDDNICNTVILNRKGILCELYSDFYFSYVGGGFEIGVHSILEPYVSKCTKISCGKLHQKSTEFDLAHNDSKITELTSSEDFIHWFMPAESLSSSDLSSKDLEKYEQFKREIFIC